MDNGGDPDAHAIRKGQVVGFLQWRKNHSPDGTERRKALSARSLAKDRATLHAVFAYAEELEIVDSNPVSKTKPPKSDGRDPIILDDDQLEKLLEACKREKSDPLGAILRLYVLTLAETGARCESEALWLKWEDVKLEDGFIWIGSDGEHRTKSGKGRWVPMTPRLRAAMKDHFAAYRFKVYGTPPERSEWVFHHPVKRRRAKAGDRIGSLRRGFAAAVERADLTAELNQHDLRHRRVTKWLAEGKPATAVKEAMGHADLRTTMGYQHLAREHLRVLVEEPSREELMELAK